MMLVAIAALAPSAGAWNPPGPNCSTYADSNAMSLDHPTTQMIARHYSNCSNGIHKVEFWANINGWTVVSVNVWNTNYNAWGYYKYSNQNYSVVTGLQIQDLYTRTLYPGFLSIDYPQSLYYDGWYAFMNNQGGLDASSVNIKWEVFGYKPLLHQSCAWCMDVDLHIPAGWI